MCCLLGSRGLFPDAIERTAATVLKAAVLHAIVFETVGFATVRVLAYSLVGLYVIGRPAFSCLWTFSRRFWGSSHSVRWSTSGSSRSRYEVRHARHHAGRERGPTMTISRLQPRFRGATTFFAKSDYAKSL